MSRKAKELDNAKKRRTVKRLLIANLLALLGLLTVTVVTLFCLGLLNSIVAFIF